MSSRRVLKAAQAIREVVGMAIITDLKDPRIRDVTVTMVEVSPDMRQAKVHVSVMGDQTKQDLCLRGLQNSAGYLQQKVGKRIDTRYTPRLQFVLDKGIKHALTVTRILEDVLPKEESNQAASTSDDSSGSGDNAIAAGEDVVEESIADSSSDLPSDDTNELSSESTDHSDERI